MILGNAGIERCLENGTIKIEPFIRAQLQINSYDVRLGNWFYYENTRTRARLIDPRIRLAAQWIGPINALNAYELTPYDSMHSILVEGAKIVILPGQTVLAHTIEYVSTSNNIVAMLNTRSTIERLGLDVCKSAGFGDVGYAGRWTLEISNHNTHNALYLAVGERIGQLSFQAVSEVSVRYTGKYGKWRGQWQPADMLPKLYRDEPVPIDILMPYLTEQTP